MSGDITESIPKKCPDCAKPYIAYKLGKETYDECPHCRSVEERKVELCSHVEK